VIQSKSRGADAGATGFVTAVDFESLSLAPTLLIVALLVCVVLALVFVVLLQSAILWLHGQRQ